MKITHTNVVAGLLLAWSIAACSKDPVVPSSQEEAVVPVSQEEDLVQAAPGPDYVMYFKRPVVANQKLPKTSGVAFTLVAASQPVGRGSIEIVGRGINVTTGEFTRKAANRYEAQTVLNLSNVPVGPVTVRLRVTRYDAVSRTNKAYTAGVVAQVAPYEASPEFSGCRIPRADLRVVTGAQAATMANLSGLLIKGSFATMAGQVGTDFIVEAVADMVGENDPSALITRGTGGGTFQNFTVTGLERDAAGNKVRLHEVRQGVHGSGHRLSWGEIEWTNDGVFLGSGTEVRFCYIHSHTRVMWDDPKDNIPNNPKEQHRDGCQMLQGGGQVVTDCLFDNRADLNSTVAGAATDDTYSLAASASFMINIRDRYENRTTGEVYIGLTGPVHFKRNRSIGGSSSHMNMVKGPKDPKTGKYTWEPVYAGTVLTRGVEARDNVSLEPPQHHEFLVPRGYQVHSSNVRLIGGVRSAPRIAYQREN